MNEKESNINKSNIKHQSSYERHKEVRKEERKKRYYENHEKELTSRRERYQRNKERNKKIKAAALARRKKERESLAYTAQSIKVLLSLKDYTELNSEKKKLWADFC